MKHKENSKRVGGFMVFSKCIPNFVGIFSLLGFASVAFSSVTSQTLHACYILAQDSHKESSFNALSASFENPGSDSEFLCDQFLKWSIQEECEMSHSLNKAAYFVLQKDRKNAVSAIEKTFPLISKDIHDFSESFFDWGVSVVELDKLVREK
jgi:hypothetical protein